SKGVFKVILSRQSTQTVTVDFATADGTAMAGSDYVKASGRLTFPPGTLIQTIAITIIGDTKVEPDETFTVNLTNPVNAVIVKGQGTGVIINDDGTADSRPTLSISDASLPEGDSGTTPATLTVTLSKPAQQTVTVNYATLDGTANAGSDYVAT